MSTYDRRRRRLGTIYLGQMPEEKQLTLSRTLSDLLKATLIAWQGALPRLAYITDKGSTPDDYYWRVLKKMKHPRDGRPLTWEWVLDFYHVCSYIGKMAEALFDPQTPAGAQWFAKMRRGPFPKWGRFPQGTGRGKLHNSGSSRNDIAMSLSGAVLKFESSAVRLRAEVVTA